MTLDLWVVALAAAVCVLCALSTLGCRHEWIRRRAPGRVYLECLRCLRTTPGLELSTSSDGAADDRPVRVISRAPVGF